MPTFTGGSQCAVNDGNENRDGDAEAPTPSTALIAPAAFSTSPWDDVRLQRLWLAAARKEWRTMAVIAAGDSTDTLPVAGLLAQLVWRYRGEPSMVCDLRDLTMRLVAYQIREVHLNADTGTRVLVALRSLFENPTSVLLAREADAVVLCIRLGATSFRQAEQTIKELGRERIVGSIVLGGARKASKKNRR